MNKVNLGLIVALLLAGCTSFNTNKASSPQISVMKSVKTIPLGSQYKTTLDHYIKQSLYFSHKKTKVFVHTKKAKTLPDVKQLLLQKGFVKQNIHFVALHSKEPTAYLEFDNYVVRKTPCLKYTLYDPVPPGCYAAQSRWTSFDDPKGAMGIVD